MPDTSHWRDDAAYTYFDDLDTEGLAWECLRRNPTYKAEFGKLLTQPAPDTAKDDACRRHWGLRFRNSTEAYGARHHNLLGAGGERERRAARDVPT